MFDQADLEFVRPLGEGGLGVVWLVRHLLTKRDVAVKVLRGSRALPRHQYAFEREIRSQASLHHEHVLPVLASGHLQRPLQSPAGTIPIGRAWLAMAYARGGSLAARTDLSGAEVGTVVQSILSALAHCHAVGLIHCDLKPENVLFREPDLTSLVLADFGLTQAAGHPDHPAGTPHYMAPEQFVGGSVDGRTDLYSLGCLVHRLLVGAPPFLGSFDQLRKAHLHHPLPDIGEPEVDAWLSSLTAKDPGLRPASAAAAMACMPKFHGGSHKRTESEAATTADWLLPSGHQRSAVARLGHQPVPSEVRAVSVSRYHPLNLGMGTLGVRHVPLVGREAAQQRLWDALRMAEASGPQLVCVSGPKGSGRDALLDWLGMAVREADCASVHFELVGPGEELRLILQKEERPLLEAVRAFEQASRWGGAVLVVAVVDEGGDVVLGPLGEADARALCGSTLALRPADAMRVAAECDFLPGRMVDLLTRFVVEGALEVSVRGVRLGRRAAEAGPESDTRLLLQLVQHFGRLNASVVWDHGIEPSVVADAVHLGWIDEDDAGLAILPSAPRVVLDDAFAKRVQCDSFSDLRHQIVAFRLKGDEPSCRQALLELWDTDSTLDAAAGRWFIDASQGWASVQVRVASKLISGGVFDVAADIMEGLKETANAEIIAWIHSLEAEVLVRTGRVDAAYQLVSTPMPPTEELSPELRLRWAVVRSLCLMRKGKFRTVRAELSSLIPIADGRMRRVTLSWLRIAMFELGEREEALSIGAGLAKEHPGEGHLIVHGLMLAQMGRLDEALMHVRNSAQSPFRNATNYTVLAAIHLLRGELDAARQASFRPDPGLSEPTRLIVVMALYAAETHPFFEGARYSMEHTPWSPAWIDKACLDLGRQTALAAGRLDRVSVFDRLLTRFDELS